MNLFHYTSIETLALILKNKTIRFNRLDCVDDLEESMYGSGPNDIKLGQYQFVSCWTKDSEENLALWKMYTNNKGVRICLDSDMFKTYQILESTAISYLEVMMGPETNEADRYIVERLLCEFNGSTIKDSYFKGKINSK